MHQNLSKKCTASVLVTNFSPDVVNGLSYVYVVVFYGLKILVLTFLVAFSAKFRRQSLWRRPSLCKISGPYFAGQVLLF